MSASAATSISGHGLTAEVLDFAASFASAPLHDGRVARPGVVRREKRATRRPLGAFASEVYHVALPMLSEPSKSSAQPRSASRIRTLMLSKRAPAASN